MANDGGFEGRVGFVEGKLRSAAARSRDIALNLEKSSTIFANFAKSAEKADQKMRDIAGRMEKLNELGDRVGFDKLSRDFRKFSAQKQGLKFLDLLDQGFTKITKSIMTLGSGIITGVFNFLIDSIKRVYELQERWTRAIGGFNMKIGGMTAGLKQAQRAATAWSGTIRGLTNGDIQEGIQMFEEFTMAMSRIVKQGDTWSKFGLQLARGFNLGGDGAGRLAATFEDMGASGKEAIGVMSELIDSANLVGVPVNQLASDVVEANTYMARFGKEGAKGFVTAAGYARKFAMSMKELQAATERFDLFDDSAQTAAKLNSTFGTLINSVDLMLMDDPAQRMESIRQSLLAQGKTYDTLSIKERRFAAETLGVNEQQLATLLSLKDANFTYSEMIEKQQATEAKEAEAKKRMQVQLQKTAQTMYAFGAAFDRITMAIAKAIRPLLEVLGLAKAGGKDMKSFGQVMESVTKHIEHFFESLAENPKWIGFMKDLARGLKDVGRAVGNFIMSGKAAKWAGELAGFLHDVYDWGKKAFGFMVEAARKLEGPLRFVLSHIKEIAIIWAGFQGLKLAGGIAGKVGNIRSAFGPRWDGGKVRGRGGGGGMVATPAGTGGGDPFGIIPESDWLAGYSTGGRRRSRFGGLARGAGRMLGGLGTGGLVGGSLEAMGVKGAGTGGMIGGAVGSLLGPLGGVVGSFAGAAIGGLIGRLFKGKRSELDIARENLKKTIEAQQRAAEQYSDILDLTSKRMQLADNKREAQTATINRLDEEARKTKGKLNVLGEGERAILIKRIEELERFGIHAKDSGKLLAMLNTPGGPIMATDAQLRNLAASSQSYEEEIAKLRGLTAAEVEQKVAEATARSAAGALGLQASQAAHEVKLEEKLLKDMRGGRIVKEDALAGADLAGFLGSKGAGGALIKARIDQKTMSAKEREQLGREFALWKQDKKVTDLKLKQTDLEERAVNSKMDLDKQLFLIQARGAIKSDVRFMEHAKILRGTGMTDENEIFANFVRGNRKEFSAIYGDLLGDLMNPRPMAAGGIVRRPMHALIGESGPEAVIPLRALARGRGPSRTVRGVRGAVNMAAGGSGGSTTTVQVISSDVHIDGVKAGKAITKIAISTAEG